MTELSQLLISWFNKNKRDLPWRECITPYRVWVSEVMLQQTQVFTVIPYFNRWMGEFPTLRALAEAPIEAVIKLWEGLGYYSRARNLHLGAQQVIEIYKGQLPNSKEELLKIKGIGPYTASAILSFAFHERSCLIDGNVKRVMARLFELNSNFSNAKEYDILEELLNTLVPESHHWHFNEAMMELGATVCKPKQPLCQECPIQTLCQSFRNKTQHQFPIPKKRKTSQKLYRAVYVFQYQNHWLIQKQSKALMKDLYEFVSQEIDAEKTFNPLDFDWSQQAIEIQPLTTVRHAYTYFQVELVPYLVSVKEPIAIENYEWVSIEEVLKKPFSAGHRKILEKLLECMRI